MTDTELDRHWPAIQEHLRAAVPESVHQMWFAPLRAVGLDGSTLTVAAPDAHVRWLADRFARVLQTSAAAELGPDAAVDVVAAGSASPAERAAPARPGPPDRRAGELNPGYTFD
ncbi:MAG TPA: DnaA N-terminal domain-containing protein, partial [Solirubrobacteraceae bacterium]|nr:DnaA N-terminal domain-containing protein [Solirubrobacteraceae bacterium]